MNEAETRAELIDPALKVAGWGVVEGSRVRREVITLGRLQGAGTRAKQEVADYVLVYRNQKLAVIEAKRRSAPDTEGLGQAKRYAEKLPHLLELKYHAISDAVATLGQTSDIKEMFFGFQQHLYARRAAA